MRNLEIGVCYKGRNKKPERVRCGGIRAAAPYGIWYLIKTDDRGTIGIMNWKVVGFWGLYLAASIAVSSCASSGGGLVSTGQTSEADGFSLDEAIELSAEDVTTKLPNGTRVVIVAFSSENDSLSNYIMDELTGALVDGSLEVADRRNLAYVYRELNFQMSGDVSDETAVSIGKFLGARYVITGQFVKAGDRYRYRLSGINVETAVQESSTRLNVRFDRTLQSFIADVRQTPIVIASAGYGDQQNAQPATAGAYLDRGILFASHHDWDTAIVEYTEAIRLNPNFALAYSNRGCAYVEKGMYDRALEDLNAALRIDPNSATVYNNRGWAYLKKGMYDRALEDLNAALRINPNSATAYNNRGWAYVEKGMYDRAIEDLNAALRINPNFVQAYNNRGNAYYGKRMYDRAIEDYSAALRLDPNYTTARDNLELAQGQKGR
jgi:tetratricopeptide (TPR) repeat protein